MPGLGLGLGLGLVRERKAGGITLPYTLDPALLPDGALPREWSGATFEIFDGRVSNSPETGAELFPDPGLEGVYTGGLNASLTKAGTPTVAESADAHDGSKAQSFIGVSQNIDYLYYLHVPTAHRWYIASVFTKRTAGANGSVALRAWQSGGLELQYPTIHDAAVYARRSIGVWANSANSLIVYPLFQTAPGSDTVLGDTVSLKEAVTASVFASVEFGVADMTVKTRWDNPASPNLLCGVLARLDNVSDPQNYIFAWKHEYMNTGWVYVGMAEVVAGVMTKLIDNTYVAAANDPTKNLEIRLSGPTAQLFYGNAQVDTDKTTSSVLTGTRHGIFHLGGGNSLNHFFVG